MNGKRKLIILVGLSAALGSIGLIGGYFGLRELLAPRDSSLVRRVGLAGVYLVAREGQKFLINSLGGMEKIESAREAPVPTPSPVDTRSTSPASGTIEPNTLPQPPPTSYAAHILELYRQSLKNSKQYSKEVTLVDQQPADPVDPSRRSSFVEDRPRQAPKQEATPTPAPVVEGTPSAPAPMLSPDAKGTPTRVPASSPSPATKILQDSSATQSLNPGPTDTEVSDAKRQASWAGLLAAQNVIKPWQSANLMLRHPVTSQNKARPTSDTAPGDKQYVVDDALDTAPTGDGTETYTMVSKPPALSPDDVVPSASLSPTSVPAPEPEHHPTVAEQKPKSHTKPKVKAGTRVDADEKPSFWQMLFKAKGSKQPESKPIDATKATANN